MERKHARCHPGRPLALQPLHRQGPGIREETPPAQHRAESRAGLAGPELCPRHFAAAFCPRCGLHIQLPAPWPQELLQTCIPGPFWAPLQGDLRAGGARVCVHQPVQEIPTQPDSRHWGNHLVSMASSPNPTKGVSIQVETLRFLRSLRAALGKGPLRGTPPLMLPTLWSRTPRFYLGSSESPPCRNTDVQFPPGVGVGVRDQHLLCVPVFPQGRGPPP